MKNKTTILWILCLCLSKFTLSQDIEFSQFFNAPLHLNPAFAGVDYGPRICVNYRNQWPSLNNAYITYAASYDQFVPAISSGFGFIGMSDRQGNGLYSINTAAGIYAFQISASENFAFRIGMQAGIVQKSIQIENLVFGENIDPIDGSVIGTSSDIPDLSSRTYPDFSGGLLAYGKFFYVGFSAKHVTQPNESLSSSNTSTVPVRLAGNFGLEFRTPDNNRTLVYFSPNVMFVQQSSFKQLTAGGIFGVGVVYGGIAFRHSFENSDAIIPMVGTKIGIFKMGYSYDLTISNLKGSTGGAHEVAIVMNFHDSENAQRITDRRYTFCPLTF